MRAIAAMSRNRVIGDAGTIPWRIPDELRWFRRTTLDGMVLMGRRTFASLPKPLDRRVTVVLTRDPARLLSDPALAARFAGAVHVPPLRPSEDVVCLDFPALPGTELRLARSLDALERAGLPAEDAWLAGGAQMYAQYLDRCSELLLSVVDREVEGDVRFPPFEHLFEDAVAVAAFPEFRVHRWVRRSPGA